MCRVIGAHYGFGELENVDLHDVLVVGGAMFRTGDGAQHGVESKEELGDLGGLR